MLDYPTAEDFRSFVILMPFALMSFALSRSLMSFALAYSRIFAAVRAFALTCVFTTIIGYPNRYCK